MSVAVIVPWRDTSPWRNVVCEVVVEHYRNELAVDEVTLVDAGGSDFNRAASKNLGVTQTTADVLVIADADTLVPGANLRAAVDFARECSVVVPFDTLVGLSQSGTEMVMRGMMPPFADWRGDAPEHVELDWRQRSDGGVNVCTRAAFEASGGFDERFVGWGFEDSSFAFAMHTLVGPPMWLSATAVHLWHPLDPTRRDSALQSTLLGLCKRYEQAAGDVDAMTALVAERAA